MNGPGEMPPEGYHPYTGLSRDSCHDCWWSESDDHRSCSSQRAALPSEPCKVLPRGRNSTLASPRLLTPRQAAAKLGMAGRIRTVKTPGGHHRIPIAALDPFLPSPQDRPVPAASAGAINYWAR